MALTFGPSQGWKIGCSDANVASSKLDSISPNPSDGGTARDVTVGQVKPASSGLQVKTLPSNNQWAEGAHNITIACK